MKARLVSTLLAFSALAFTSLPLSAQEHCGPDQAGCVEAGTWELQVAVGAGVRTNPLAESQDIPLIIIPQVRYYGKRFFLDNLELGYTLVDQPRWMLNGLVTPGRDGLYFFRDDWGRFALDGGLNLVSAPSPELNEAAEPEWSNDAEQGPHQNGQEQEATSPNLQSFQGDSRELHKRRIAGLAGFEISARLGIFEWQLQALTDATGIHNGEELRFAMSTGAQARQHKLGLALGLNWKSAEVMEYYYGVTQGEATAQRPTYRPGSGTSPFVRLSWSRPVNQSWRWLGSIQYEYLSESVRESPLVNKDQVLQVFVGGVYHF